MMYSTTLALSLLWSDEAFGRESTRAPALSCVSWLCGQDARPDGEKYFELSISITFCEPYERGKSCQSNILQNMLNSLLTQNPLLLVVLFVSNECDAIGGAFDLVHVLWRHTASRWARKDWVVATDFSAQVDHFEMSSILRRLVQR